MGVVGRSDGDFDGFSVVGASDGADDTSDVGEAEAPVGMANRDCAGAEVPAVGGPLDGLADGDCTGARVPVMGGPLDGLPDGVCKGACSGRRLLLIHSIIRSSFPKNIQCLNAWIPRHYHSSW